jgi:hypothetical protein
MLLCYVCRCMIEAQRAAQRRWIADAEQEKVPWVSPAVFAQRMTLHVHQGAGATAPTLRYPCGQGFTQRMRLPAVWCSSLGTPSPDQEGGRLLKHADPRPCLGTAMPARSTVRATHQPDTAQDTITASGAACAGQVPPTAGAPQLQAHAEWLQCEDTGLTLTTESSWAAGADAQASPPCSHAVAAGASTPPTVATTSEVVVLPASEIAATSLAGPAPLDTATAPDGPSAGGRKPRHAEPSFPCSMLVDLPLPRGRPTSGLAGPACSTLRVRWRGDLVYAIPPVPIESRGTMLSIRRSWV